MAFLFAEKGVAASITFAPSSRLQPNAYRNPASIYNMDIKTKSQHLYVLHKLQLLQLGDLCRSACCTLCSRKTTKQRGFLLLLAALELQTEEGTN